MKKKAFTLAEVLITLGILGIIGALTLPALFSNTEKNTWVNQMKAGHSILTNGFAQMMATEMVDSLRDASLWNCLSNDVVSKGGEAHSCVYKIMRNYFSLSEATDGLPTEVKVYDIQGNNMSSDFRNTIRYNLPNGSTINVQYKTSSTDKSRSDCEEIKNNGGSMCGIAATIYLDVNGNKRPNVIGKDVYLFMLAPNGKLYPYGGKDWSLFAGSDYWKNNCAGKPLPSNCKGGDSYPLTGRVVEEGYQINYY